MKKNELIVLGGIVVIVIGLFIMRSGNGGGSAAITSTDGGSRSTGVSSAGGDTQAVPAPDFTLDRLGGGEIRLADYKGEKPVVLDFWTSWCPNCQRDMPKTSRLYEEYRDQVEVIGINMQETEGITQKFIDQRNIIFPIVMDPSGRTSNQYGVKYTNTHVLIDKDGNVMDSFSRDLTEADLKNLIEG